MDQFNRNNRTNSHQAINILGSSQNAQLNNNNNNTNIINTGAGVDDLTNRLVHMNVDPTNARQQYDSNEDALVQRYDTDTSIQLSQQFFNYSQPDGCAEAEEDSHMSIDEPRAIIDSMLINEQDTTGLCPSNCENIRERRGRADEKSSNILIVTNLDPTVFNDDLVRAKFESLFLSHDGNVTFRYLKSFRRVRLDFSTAEQAEQARISLNNYLLGNQQFKCYLAQIIRPNNSSLDKDSENDNNSRSYLRLPKLTKQFLISPPASPPVGWEPVHEGSPCIDVQLISAIANLIPGEVHEIHPGNKSQPGIFVEVCEEPNFDSPLQPSVGTASVSHGSGGQRIPKTPKPSKAVNTSQTQSAAFGINPP